MNDSINRLRKDVQHDVTLLVRRIEKQDKEIRNLRLTLELLYNATEQESKEVDLSYV